MRTAGKKILSLALAMLLALGTLPQTVFAVGESEGGTITAFEPLEDSVKNQAVPLGTSLENLNLPASLTATVEVETSAEQTDSDSGSVQDSGTPAQDNPVDTNTDLQDDSTTGEDSVSGNNSSGSDADEQQNGTPSDAQPSDGGASLRVQSVTGSAITLGSSGADDTDSTQQAVSVPVLEWTSEPEYDSETLGTYIFTPVLDEAWSLAKDVELPTVTVQVIMGIMMLNGSPSTGMMTIGGTSGYDLAVNQTGTGWDWEASTSTLTLDSTYAGQEILFQCASGDTIYVEYSGNVTINKMLISEGSMDILCTGADTDKLTVINDSAAIVSLGDLFIHSGTISAKSTAGNAAFHVSGSLYVLGSTSVEAYGGGVGTIYCQGTVTIDTTGSISLLNPEGFYIKGTATVHYVNGTVETGDTTAIAPSVSGTSHITMTMPGTATRTVDLGAGYFEATGYTVASEDPSIATAAQNDNTITITGVAMGTTSVTVTWVGGALAGQTVNIGVDVTTPIVVNAEIPGITGQPQDATYNQGGTATALSVTASVADGGTLSYQWYRNTANSNTGGTAVGTNSASYTPVTNTIGTMYYYCVVTNTNNSAVNVTATATSDAAAVTVSSSSGGGSNGGSSDSSDSNRDTIVTIPPVAQPDWPTIGSVTDKVAGTNTQRTFTITDTLVKAALEKAQAEAKKQGRTAYGIGAQLALDTPATAGLTATLERAALNRLVSEKAKQFTITGAPISLTLDREALAEIQKQSTGNITITVKPVTVKGVRNAYDITISTVKDGKTVTMTSLGTGTATLSIPFTPAKGEAAGGFYAVYVDANGKVNRIADSSYDTNSGSVIFSTDHFSVYGVGYTAPSAKFTDISSHWAKESIDYVVGRGLLSGTAETTFAPDAAMTRGMLVTALGRLAGVDVKAYTTNSFTDVKADSAFRPYIEWAYKKGIVQGIGNQQFAPDRAITREEIAVIFANYAKATGYTLPVSRTATTYADASSIGSVYKTAVTSMQQAGIMMGGTSNNFNPKSSATRAEVSAMLHRYIKLTIDPATAQGWAKNDAGQFLYYKDGKTATGTQTIDGVKYFFNTDGTLKTGWVQDGSNWHFYSGNNKRYYFDTYGNMISGKWLQIDGKWYYFYADGSLAISTKIDDYEVDENGVRKEK